MWFSVSFFHEWMEVFLKHYNIIYQRRLNTEANIKSHLSIMLDKVLQNIKQKHDNVGTILGGNIIIFILTKNVYVFSIVTYKWVNLFTITELIFNMANLDRYISNNKMSLGLWNNL